jgi:hypothetical protein
LARVHFVKKARKDNKALGIKKGQSYYWWANRMPGSAQGIKRASLTPPRPSQVMAPGSFGSSVAELEERIGDITLESLVADGSDDNAAENLKSELDDIVGEIRQLAEEQIEKYDNMPEGLQQGDTGQLLEKRAQALNDWADELEGIEPDEDDVQSALDEAQAMSPSL